MYREHIYPVMLAMLVVLTFTLVVSVVSSEFIGKRLVWLIHWLGDTFNGTPN